jgi:N-acetylmuramoyl-L-alanine amidase
MKSSLTQGLALLDSVYARFLLWSRASLGTVSLVAALAISTSAQTSTERSPEMSASGSSTPTVLIQRSPLREGSRGAEVSELQALLQLLGYYSGPINGVYDNNTAIAVANFQTAAGLAADGVVGPTTWDRLLPVEPAPPTTAQANLLATTNTANPSADAFPTPTLINSDRSTVAPATTPRSTDNPTVNSSPTPTPATNPAPAPTVELPILRLGMQGPAVTRLQERLQAIGAFSGAIDGVFGPATEAAVKAAQQRYQLDTDGVVGPATWQALLSK